MNAASWWVTCWMNHRTVPLGKLVIEELMLSNYDIIISYMAIGQQQTKVNIQLRLSDMRYS